MADKNIGRMQTNNTYISILRIKCKSNISDILI